MKSETVGLRDLRTGFFWISHALHSYKLTWRALLAYMAIAAAANANTHNCHKPIEQLAEWAGVSRSTLKRGLLELEKKATIRVKRRSKKNPTTGKKEQIPNEYILIELKPSRAAFELPESLR